MRLKTVAAVAASGLLLSACGGEPEAASGEDVAASDELLTDRECGPENAVMLVSRVSGAVQDLPADHPNLDEIQAAAGNFITTFNTLDQSGEVGSPDEMFAELCAAYDEYVEVAK